ncbi:hypothetical protein BASA81_001014 [Batrachochytrium salamandrivorans]|nr:hypothetical protein BASA81_001014 [Batrachochytrium salamandrivorans]
MPILLLMGLDEAGKTKLLYTLKLGQITESDYRAVEFEPTVAFNYELLTWMYKRTQVQYKTWDLAGRRHLRKMWRSFYESAPPDAVMFVVDERKRLEEARFEFTQLLHDASLQRSVFVVVVNVRDEADTVPTDLKDAEDRVRVGLGMRPNEQRVKVFAVRLGKDIINRDDQNLNNVLNYISHQMVTSTTTKPL